MDSSTKIVIYPILTLLMLVLILTLLSAVRARRWLGLNVRRRRGEHPSLLFLFSLSVELSNC